MMRQKATRIAQKDTPFIIKNPRGLGGNKVRHPFSSLPSKDRDLPSGLELALPILDNAQGKVGVPLYSTHKCSRFCGLYGGERIEIFDSIL